MWECPPTEENMGASEIRDSLAGRAIRKESPLPNSLATYRGGLLGGIKPPPTFIT
jgi:hypothetical protein